MIGDVGYKFVGAFCTLLQEIIINWENVRELKFLWLKSFIPVHILDPIFSIRLFNIFVSFISFLFFLVKSSFLYIFVNLELP